MKVDFSLRMSARARRIWLTISHDGDCVVTVPHRTNMHTLESFIKRKAAWIKKQLQYFKNTAGILVRKNTRADYLQNKERAREIANERLAHFNKSYNFEFRRVSIKNQKTRWGSCSKKGNLNFNYKIALLPEKLTDYIVVHELCHLGELNHSKRFWNLVAKTIPEHKSIRKELKDRHHIL